MFKKWQYLESEWIKIRKNTKNIKSGVCAVILLKLWKITIFISLSIPLSVIFSYFPLLFFQFSWRSGYLKLAITSWIRILTMGSFFKGQLQNTKVVFLNLDIPKHMTLEGIHPKKKGEKDIPITKLIYTNIRVRPWTSSYHS